MLGIVFGDVENAVFAAAPEVVRTISGRDGSLPCTIMAKYCTR